MANLFKNNNAQTNFSERQLLEGKYNSSRYNLLIVVIFTVINAVLLLTNANTYFLFSAYIPYFLVDMGMFLCGKYPDAVYEGLDGMEFMDGSFLVVMCVLALIGIGVYLLCWFMSKKKSGWLVAALVFIIVDTLALIGLVGFAVDMIIDYLFHGLVIYYLVSGIMAHKKLQNLPEDEPIIENVGFEEITVVENTSAETVEASEAEETQIEENKEN